MTTYETTVAGDSPVAWWKLDETTGTAAEDYGSGIDADGTYTGTYTLDQVGMDGTRPSVALNGSSGYVDIGALPAKLQFASGDPFSIEAWVAFRDTTTNAAAVVSEAYAGDNTVRYMLGFYDGSTNTRKPSFGWYNGAWRLIQSATTITDSDWHHLVGTFDGTQLRLYVDGVLVAGPTTPGGTQPGGTESLYIGRRWDGGYLYAWVDEVAMYATELTSTQVDAHWDARDIPQADSISFTQVATLVAGSDISDRRFSQVVTLVAGTDTSDRRVSQAVLLVAGKRGDPQLMVITTSGLM